MRFTARIAAALAVCAACTAPESNPPTTGAVDKPIAGDWNDVKIAADAPWRMEPRWKDGTWRYGAVPIQLTIHDSDKAEDDIGGDSIRHVIAIEIIEHGPGGQTSKITYKPHNLHEVQKSSVWHWVKERFDAEPCRPGTADLPGCGQIPDFRITCRMWDDPTNSACADMDELRYVQDVDEWHGHLFHYFVFDHAPGTDVRLTVTPVVRENVQGSFDDDEHVATSLWVHLGEAPLPRFGSEWAYGDLHYHSELTNNFGEQAYGFRGTIHAMAAIGLDFAFATDHTSNNERIFDAADDLWAPYSHNGLGDASPTKWAHGHRELNGPGGVNHEVLSHRARRGDGTLAVPQIFLGSEVDVIPESANKSDTIGFRNIQYDKHHLCGDNDCYHATGDGTYLVRDDQGLNTTAYARQHVIHLPTDSTRDDAGVFGDTSFFGGATRRLKDLIAYDLDQQQKGYAFLAHPFIGTEGGGLHSQGPSMVPFTEPQLLKALASPYILGLQLWNENDRFEVSVCGGTPEGAGCSPLDDLIFGWADAVNRTAHFEAEMRRWTSGWDAVLLMGLDPVITRTIEWLRPREPRRMYMAGGSDAHGDFNYRRHGRVAGTSAIVDTALGTPRNLVYTGAPDRPLQGPGFSEIGYAYRQEAVTDGLASGRFSITDGPALRIVYDANDNGIIDDEDLPMGAFAPHRGLERPTFLVEWLSTPEWGDVDRIELYVGSYATTTGKTALYRPPLPGDSGLTWTDASGATYRRETDAGGVAYADGRLSVSVSALQASGQAGVYAFQLDLRDFPVFAGASTSSRTLSGATMADRFYVRAVARTETKNGTRRWAYTNPVWITHAWDTALLMATLG